MALREELERESQLSRELFALVMSCRRVARLLSLRIEPMPEQGALKATRTV
jgi:hypothetical protein